MKQNKKRNIEKEMRGAIRKSKIEQGFFDGRFVSRFESSKKIYKRKIKHKQLKNRSYGD